ncbi:HEPN domain-containing protein [Chloroflexi bacterium CFX6]|nr:HEPN domain-containing protein [Chloroflexi bacterium CFX6]
MSIPQIQILIDRADESHQAAKVLLDKGFFNYSAAQSYYTIFYLTEALLFSKGLQFSSHSAVMAAFGKEFAKSQILDPNTIAVSSSQRDAVRRVITVRKAA